MPVSGHIEITCIDNCLAIALDRKHGGTENVASIVGGDLYLTIRPKRDSLMQLNRRNLIYTPLYHFLAESIYAAFLGDGDFSEVLEHEWDYGFGGCGGDDGAGVPNSLRKIRQRAAMIQMKVTHNHQVNDVGEVDFEIFFGALCCGTGLSLALLSLFLLVLLLQRRSTRLHLGM